MYFCVCHIKNDDNYHKGRQGEGQRVIIEIIISENDNDGRPFSLPCLNALILTYYCMDLPCFLVHWKSGVPPTVTGTLTRDSGH